MVSCYDTWVVARTMGEKLEDEQRVSHLHWESSAICARMQSVSPERACLGPDNH